jgi:hypothetical protein
VEKRITAIHEAGHAVAHVRLGIFQDCVTITPLDPDLAGAVTAEDGVWNPADAENQVLALYAGYAATVVAGIPELIAMRGCDDDFGKAEALIAKWGIGSTEDLRHRAVLLMSQPENIKAVQLVARELLARQSLSSDLIFCLVDMADGEATAQDYQQLKAWITG